MITLEDIARAITIADGVDPDAEGYGLGHSMPEGERYPLWRAREKQAQAVLRLAARQPLHGQRSKWPEGVTAMKFCLDCKHLESETEQARSAKLRPRLCLRPAREILDMVTGQVLATSREQVAARDERKGFDPGACSPEGKFFDPR